MSKKKKRIKYTNLQKLEYYSRRVNDVNLELSKREFASRRILQLTTVVKRGTSDAIRSKRIITDKTSFSPVWAQNYAITRKPGSKSHPVIPVLEINGRYAIVPTSSERVKKKNAVIINGIEKDGKEKTYVILDLKTRTADRRAPLRSKIFDYNKNGKRPLRELDVKELNIIQNLLNANESNRIELARFKDTDK